LQEAKWEADYLTKIQDTDGGFYFLVYPQNREYESNVTPDHGDAQVVWPKTTSVTAAAVAALAQCASSPLMKQKYPAAAALYLQKAAARLAIPDECHRAIRQGRRVPRRSRITAMTSRTTTNSRGPRARCFSPRATRRSFDAQIVVPRSDRSGDVPLGWWRQYACYGNAVRSYAFAVKSGRMTAGQLDGAYLAKCITRSRTRVTIR